MRTLKESMELAGQCHLAWLDPDRDWMPAGGYEVAHDVGRWWDAMLRLETATGFAIPAQIEEAMLRNLQRLMGNPDGLLVNDPEIEWMKDKAIINPHNLREGMLAVAALARYRRSDWARQAGHRLLQTIDRCLQPDGRLDFTRLQIWNRMPLTNDPSHDQPAGAVWFDATANTGRALEAILAFYDATGDPLALGVADRIARHHLANTVHLDGSPRAEILHPSNVGHNHSYLGTLRGLLLFGLLTRQREYVDAVNATYRRSLWQHNITESGWTPHDLGKTRFPNAFGDPVAETASCGDVVQLALWLALRCDQYELLDDVERLIRSRILPAQITEDDLADPGNAEVRLGPRHLGGWGVHGAPYGKGCILDVLAAVLHTLTDVYDHIVTREAIGLVIHLHFTCSSREVELDYTRDRDACLAVRPKVAGPVAIRVPGWVPRDSVHLSINGTGSLPKFIGPYVFVAQSEPGRSITLRYPLPERVSTETFPSGRAYRLKWRGDEVVGVSPREMPLAAYPSFDTPDSGDVFDRIP